MTMTTVQLVAKKDILLMDIGDFLAYDPHKPNDFTQSHHTKAINALRNNWPKADKTGKWGAETVTHYGYFPVALLLTRSKNTLEKGAAKLGPTGLALVEYKLHESGLEVGQLCDPKSYAAFNAENLATQDDYSAAIDQHIDHLRGIPKSMRDDRNQNPEISSLTLREFLDLDIVSKIVPTLTRHALRHEAGDRKLTDVIALTAHDLKDMAFIGEKGLKAFKQALNVFGLELESHTTEQILSETVRDFLKREDARKIAGTRGGHTLSHHIGERKLADVLIEPERQLRTIPDFGPDCMRRFKSALAFYGLQFADDAENILVSTREEPAGPATPTL